LPLVLGLRLASLDFASLSLNLGLCDLLRPLRDVRVFLIAELTFDKVKEDVKGFRNGDSPAPAYEPAAFYSSDETGCRGGTCGPTFSVI
jgi:hypothetical protein